jgi:hypothetical protein
MDQDQFADPTDEKIELKGDNLRAPESEPAKENGHTQPPGTLSEQKVSPPVRVFEKTTEASSVGDAQPDNSALKNQEPAVAGNKATQPRYQVTKFDYLLMVVLTLLLFFQLLDRILISRILGHTGLPGVGWLACFNALSLANMFVNGTKATGSLILLLAPTANGAVASNMAQTTGTMFVTFLQLSMVSSLVLLFDSKVKPLWRALTAALLLVSSIIAQPLVPLAYLFYSHYRFWRFRTGSMQSYLYLWMTIWMVLLLIPTLDSVGGISTPVPYLWISAFTIQIPLAFLAGFSIANRTQPDPSLKLPLKQAFSKAALGMAPDIESRKADIADLSKKPFSNFSMFSLVLMIAMPALVLSTFFSSQAVAILYILFGVPVLALYGTLLSIASGNWALCIQIANIGLTLGKPMCLFKPYKQWLLVSRAEACSQLDMFEKCDADKKAAIELGPSMLEKMFPLSAIAAERVGILIKLGRYQEASAIAKDGLVQAEQMMANNPTPANLNQLIMTVHGLSRFYSRTGQVEQASKLATVAMNLADRIVDDRPNWCVVSALLGKMEVDIERGDYASAARFLERLEEMSAKEVTVSSGIKIDIADAKAMCFLKAGKYSEAEVLFQNVLAAHKKRYPQKSAKSALIMTELAKAQCLQGKFKPAGQLLQDALERQEAGPGLDNASAINVLETAAEAYHLMGNVSEAKRLETMAATTRTIVSEACSLGDTTDPSGSLENLIENTAALCDEVQSPTLAVIAKPRIMSPTQIIALATNVGASIILAFSAFSIGGTGFDSLLVLAAFIAGIAGNDSLLMVLCLLAIIMQGKLAWTVAALIGSCVLIFCKLLTVARTAAIIRRQDTAVETTVTLVKPIKHSFKAKIGDSQSAIELGSPSSKELVRMFDDRRILAKTISDTAGNIKAILTQSGTLYVVPKFAGTLGTLNKWTTRLVFGGLIALLLFSKDLPSSSIDVDKCNNAEKLCQFAKHEGRYKQELARQALEKAARIDPNGASGRFAQDSLRTGYPIRARTKADRAACDEILSGNDPKTVLAKYPNCDYAIQLAARTLIKEGKPANYAEANSLLAELVRRNPDYLSGLIDRYDALKDSHNDALASQVLQHAAAVAPTDERVLAREANQWLPFLVAPKKYSLLDIPIGDEDK